MQRDRVIVGAVGVVMLAACVASTTYLVRGSHSARADIRAESEHNDAERAKAVADLKEAILAGQQEIKALVAGLEAPADTWVQLEDGTARAGERRGEPFEDWAARAMAARELADLMNGRPPAPR